MWEEKHIFAVGISFVIGMCISMLITIKLIDITWQKDAINNKVGEYNSQTGEFQWITEPESSLN